MHVTGFFSAALGAYRVFSAAPHRSGVSRLQRVFLQAVVPRRGGGGHTHTRAPVCVYVSQAAVGCPPGVSLPRRGSPPGCGRVSPTGVPVPPQRRLPTAPSWRLPAPTSPQTAQGRPEPVPTGPGQLGASSHTERPLCARRCPGSPADRPSAVVGGGDAREDV